MPRNPNATSPNAKIGAANLKRSGIQATMGESVKVASRHAENIRNKMHRPIQNAEKLPATRPDKMFSDAPPCFEQVVTSLACWDLVLVKILVNSGITAPATVPQEMMADNTHHSSGLMPICFDSRK